MNTDLKSELDAQLPDGPAPVTLDADDMVAAGRRAQTRRRLLASGTSAMALAVVGALGIGAVMGAGAPADGIEVAAGSQAPDLPELDPDGHYNWGISFPVSETEASREYTSAFWNYIDQNMTDMTVAEEDAAGAFIAETRNLTSVSPGEDNVPVVKPVGYERDILNLSSQPPVDGQYPGEEVYSALEVSFPDAEATEFLDVQVYEPGTFAVDSENFLDLARCVPSEEYGGQYFHDPCEITVEVGLNGEDLRYLSGTYEGEVVMRSVVVYRDDGSALLVQLDSFPSTDGPSLSHEELAALALALPVV